MKPRRAPEVCPVCDWEVPPNAKACPNCGACHQSGWKEDDDDTPEEIDYDVLDLPDEVLDEDDRRARESRRVKRMIPSRWRWIALGLVVFWLLYFWWTSGAWRPW